MALIKQGAFSFLHVNQTDTPQPGTATPAGFKAMLDSQANELKTTLNTNVDALTSTVNGSSNIGSPPLVAGGSTTVMGQLQYLKDTVDLKENADNITTSRKLSATGDFTGTISGTASATISASSLEVTGARGGFASLNLRLDGLVNDIGTRETATNITTNRKLSAAGDFTGTINGVAASTVVSGSAQGNTNAANIGTLANLQTTDKTTLVGAVNEVKSTTDTTIGQMSALSTTNKTSLVGAINEVNGSVNMRAGFNTVVAGGTSVRPSLTKPMPTTFVVTATASWSTSVWCTNKIVSDGSGYTTFTLNFSNPAPAGNGTVDWVVSAITV